MGFLNHLFGSQNQSQNNASPSQERVQQQINKKEKIEHIPSSLSDAMRMVLDSHGESFLNEKAFINILVDYCLFVDKPFLKNILIGLQSNGITQKLLLCKNWELESRSIIESYCYNFGVREEHARFLVKCIGYGLHKIESVELTDTTNVPTINPKEQMPTSPTDSSATASSPPNIHPTQQSKLNNQYKYKTTKGVTLNNISPTGVIEREQFAYDETLRDVIIPEGVTAIKYGAFRNCVNLRRIIIPSSVDEIGAMVFSECYKLEQIEFRGIPNISKDLFDKKPHDIRLLVLQDIHEDIYDFFMTK